LLTTRNRKSKEKTKGKTPAGFVKREGDKPNEGQKMVPVNLGKNTTQGKSLCKSGASLWKRGGETKKKQKVENLPPSKYTPADE